MASSDPMGDQAAQDAAAAGAKADADRRRTRIAADAGVMVLGGGLAWYGFTHGSWGWKVIAAVGAFYAAYEALTLLGLVSTSASNAVNDVRAIFGLGAANPPPMPSDVNSTLAPLSATP